MKIVKVIILFFVLIGSVSIAEEFLPEKTIELFAQANDAFHQGNSSKDKELRQKYYDQAIARFETIIDDGGVRNSKLYYNLGNAYLLGQDVGRAILNYRRAIALNSNDSDILKNLSFARDQRVDKIAEKSQQRVLKTLFFWHYDFSFQTRLFVSVLLFGIAFTLLTLILWFGNRSGFRVTLIICSILFLCFVSSVLVEYIVSLGSEFGVITASEVVARQGDAMNYPASFAEPLHSGLEFELLDVRTGWYYIELADKNRCWISQNAAELI